MRTIDSSISVLKPSNIAWWHTSWTGRLILAALLIAAAAFVIMPDRTSAQGTQSTDPEVLCQSDIDGNFQPTGGVINPDFLEDATGNVVNQGLIDDCVALLTAGESLEEDADDVLFQVNWVIGVDDVEGLTDTDSWDGVTLSGTGVTSRISKVDLSGPLKVAGGTLADEWADLDKLTTLNLSDNGLRGPVPPSVWAFFDDKIAVDDLDTTTNRVNLNLDDNPMLQPSPALNLKAVVNSDAQVALSFDNIWYTTEVAAHEYRYSADGEVSWGPNDAEDSDGWMSMDTGCDDGMATPMAELCDKLDDDDARVRITITSTPAEDVDTYIYQVRSVKKVTSTTTLSMFEQLKVVLSADGDAPAVSRTFSQELVQQPRAQTVDLSRYFRGDNLTFTITDEPNPNIATAEIDGSNLKIITKREGRTAITVTARDVTGGQTSYEIRVTVVAPNNPPQLAGNIPDLTLYLDDAGTQVDMAQYFRDQDNEFLRFIPQSSNPMVVTATSVGRNVIFSVNGLGEITMTIIAQDGAGATAFGSFNITVLDPNAAPQAVGTIPPQTIRLEDPGLALSLGTYFTDADNDPLTYRAVSADTGIVTAEVTDAIATLTAVGLGGATVTVTATDPGGKSATQEILVTVLPANRPPEVVGQIPDQTLQYNDEPLGLDVTMYFTDPDGDVLSYVGQGTDESIAEVRVHSDGLVRIDPISHGEIEVTVTARDPLGASVSQSFMVTVTGNLSPEAVGVIDDQVLLEGGTAMTINVAEYFSDPNGDELTYMATSANPDAVQAVVIDGSSELVLRPFAPAEGVTVTVTAMDPEGESAAQLVAVTVAAAAPPPTATPVPTATPEPTTPPPEPTATPAPTATFVPTNGDGGFPVGLIIVLLLALAGVAAAVFIIQRRR